MGIFQQRPEEPSEWAGLPDEPWQPRLPAETLPPPVGDLGLFGTAGVSLPTALEEIILSGTPAQADAATGEE